MLLVTAKYPQVYVYSSKKKKKKKPSQLKNNARL